MRIFETLALVLDKDQNDSILSIQNTPCDVVPLRILMYDFTSFVELFEIALCLFE
jgi:hypothetical protein